MPELRQHERLQLIRSAVSAGRGGTMIRRRPFASMARRWFLASAASLIPLVASSGCISIDLFGGGAAAPLKETVLQGKRGPKILLLEIDGEIDAVPTIDPLFGSEAPSMVARVTEALDRAREDPEIRALLLRIDSPGGTVTATDQIHSEILRFKREMEVPVAAQLQSTATSGGYYIAMAADVVQAHPTTLTGSIGVIYTSVSFAGLMDKLGIEDQTITSGEQKDAGSPLRRLRPEERAQLQSIVDDLHARFRTIVAEGRPELPADRVGELADGRVFSAPQALENGLVDRVGTLREAVRMLEDRLGVSESRVVRYHRPREIRRNLYSRIPDPRPPRLAPSGDLATELAGSFALRRLDGILSRSGFLYLWWPATLR